MLESGNFVCGIYTNHLNKETDEPGTFFFCNAIVPERYQMGKSVSFSKVSRLLHIGSPISVYLT